MACGVAVFAALDVGGFQAGAAGPGEFWASIEGCMQGFIEELCWGFTVAEEAAWCCGFWGGHQDLGEVEAQRAFFNRRGSQAPPLHPGKTPPPYHTCQVF